MNVLSKVRLYIFNIKLAVLLLLYDLIMLCIPP